MKHQKLYFQNTSEPLWRESPSTTCLILNSVIDKAFQIIHFQQLEIRKPLHVIRTCQSMFERCIEGHFLRPDLKNNEWNDEDEPIPAPKDAQVIDKVRMKGGLTCSEMTNSSFEF